MDFIDTTLPALGRIRRHLLSAGRYGPSSFLVGHYGGLGEIAQGFCRTAAVSGAIYILARNIKSVIKTTNAYEVVLDDFPDTLTSDVLVTNPKYLTDDIPIRQAESKPDGVSSGAVARCVAILDAPIAFSQDDTSISDSEDPQKEEIDTALLVFPPGSLSTGSSETSVHVLMTGAGTMSAPAGRCKHIIQGLAGCTDLIFIRDPVPIDAIAGR